jgi:hypothetical protein
MARHLATVVSLAVVLAGAWQAGGAWALGQPLQAFLAPQRARPTAGARYVPPRTPWGDPDLQGVFTNSNEYATPLERPDRYAGRRLEDLSPEDLADMRRTAQQQAIDGLAQGPRGPDYWWLENLDLSKRAQPWSVVDPPDGRIPAVTSQGRARAGRVRSSFLGGPFDGPGDLGLLERCISRGIPGSMIPVMYGNTYQVVQAPGVVLITYEIIHEARVIPLDGRPHVGPAIRTYMGDARGRWDGDTLVVETTNFNQAGAYRGANAATLTVTERFRRVAPDRIAWSATIDDPDTWARPWTIAMPLTADPHPVMPYDCHEGNYGLLNILRAARAAERSPAGR